MKIIENSLNRQVELRAIAILMLRHMEVNLSPIDRIIFLRLLICYGGRKISIADLKVLADEVKVNWLTLKKSLKVLVEKGLCERVEEKVIQLNKTLLPRQVGYRWRWKPSDQPIVALEKAEEGNQPAVELKEDKSAKQSLKKMGGKKIASKFVARYPRHDFLGILFNLMFDVKISHKQKNADKLLDLNYKQWLVLANMVLSSDPNGIVFNVGTYELSKWTGMSRNALQRAIVELFNIGILRCKIDGTLNNVYLNFVSSIYFINLSHPIWGEKRTFGRYLIFNHPQQTPILKQLLEALNGWDPDEPLSDLKTTEFILDANEKTGSTGNGYVLQHNESLIQHILQTGRQWNTMFHQEFKPSCGYAAGQKTLSLNSNELNFKRLDYIFCYLASYYPHVASIARQPQSHLLPDNVKLMMLKLFREVMITQQMERTADTHRVKLFEIMMAQNHLKQQIMSLLVQYAYRSELSHVVDALAKLTDRKDYSRVVPIGCFDKTIGYKIFFSPDPHLKQDELYLIQYSETKNVDTKILASRAVKAYERSIKKMDLDLKKQIEVGLLSQQCLGLAKF